MREEGRGDAAQMMLLTAFILLIGFVALAGMVARVSQLADETGQESRRGTVLEVTAMVEGIEVSLERLGDVYPPGAAADTQIYLDATTDAMTHLDELQSARGFRFQVLDVGCADEAADPRPIGTSFPADTNDGLVWVTVSLSRGDMQMAATVVHEWDDAELGVTFECP